MSELETDNKLRELLMISRLYDFYGELLSDKSKDIFESYVLDNLSLGEIAEEVGLSRQGVRDAVVRCSDKLKKFEESLRLLEKFDAVNDLLDDILDQTKDTDISQSVSETVLKIRDIIT